MTIDEMIKLLLGHAMPDRVFGGTKYDEIIAALRAGQELSTLVLQGASIGARGERDLFAAACKFKDAATKGDEG